MTQDHQMPDEIWADTDGQWDSCRTHQGLGATRYVRADLRDKDFAVVREAVRHAEQVFTEYGHLHLAKKTEDGNRKAKVNADHALVMREALAALERINSGGG